MPALLNSKSLINQSYIMLYYLMLSDSCIQNTIVITELKHAGLILFLICSSLHELMPKLHIVSCVPIVADGLIQSFNEKVGGCSEIFFFFYPFLSLSLSLSPSLSPLPSLPCLSRRAFSVYTCRLSLHTSLVPVWEEESITGLHESARSEENVREKLTW